MTDITRMWYATAGDLFLEMLMHPKFIKRVILILLVGCATTITIPAQTPVEQQEQQQETNEQDQQPELSTFDEEIESELERIEQQFEAETKFDQESAESEQEVDRTSRDVNRVNSSPSDGHMITFVDRNMRSYSLDMMASADIVGAWDKEDPHTTGNELQVREVELGFYADIDHLANGVFTAAAHRENGETVFETHEIYFHFPEFFIPNTSARLGKMFLDVGRLNTVHRHDWSFTNPPKVHEELLDEEAAEDTGLELSFLMPWESFWQELTVGAFNGKTFGHTHVAGPDKNNPLFTAHLKQFIPFTDTLGDQFGFSYLRWHPETKSDKVTHQTGFDHLLKYAPDKYFSVQWLTEIWYRETREKNTRPYDPPASPIETRAGGYSFVELQFLENWFV
ncbi:MAG: hypothetical protein KDK34_17145, partial [Leptospiraceae bacterium]|nr:hypothetical protein [Leptospiraceae bacterium]